MIDWLAKKPAYDRRRGDGLFVALFFVVAGLCGVLSWASVNYLIDPPDRLMSHVPGHAVAYVHASQPHAVRTLIEISDTIPHDLHPSEVAMFAVPGDDELRWATLLAWRLRLPDEAENSVLKSDAVQIDDRTYLIGDIKLLTAVRLATASGNSLENDTARHNALTAMAGMHGIQAFIEPASLLTDTNSEDIVLSLLVGSTLEPMVIGASIRAEGLLARALPESAWSAAGTHANIEHSISAGRAAEPPLPANVIVRGPTPSFDLPLLITGTDQIPKDHPAPAQLSLERQQFQTTFSSPFTLWLLPAEQEIESSYLLRFPEVAPPKARTALASLMATLQPTRLPHTLPDHDVVVEYVRNDLWMAAASTEGDLSFGGTEQQPSVSVGSDGQTGSLLGTNKEVLNVYRSIPKLNTTINPFCASPSLISFGNINFSTALSASIPALLHKIGIIRMDVGISVDNSVHICGYLP